MTCIRKTLITVLATSAVTVAIGSSAMAADYSSVNALVGDQDSAAAESGGYSSPTAIVGGRESAKSPSYSSSVNAIMGDREPSQSGPSSTVARDSRSSLSSIVGAEGMTSPSPVRPGSGGSADGFDWGDALIGAGITLGLALTTVMLGMTRRRTRVEPV